MSQNEPIDLGNRWEYNGMMLWQPGNGCSKTGYFSLPRSTIAGTSDYGGQGVMIAGKEWYYGTLENTCKITLQNTNIYIGDLTVLTKYTVFWDSVSADSFNGAMFNSNIRECLTYVFGGQDKLTWNLDLK